LFKAHYQDGQENIQANFTGSEPPVPTDFNHTGG
jgi:hypothetical protein